MFENKITDTVHNILRDYVNSGDIVVDATVGNGYDTVFLAELAGDEGKVFGFDIQDLAIQSTFEQLNNKNWEKRVILIKDSHSNLKDYVDKPIKCGMFNLGYLPKGDKRVITKPETTIAAISQMLELIITGGIISIVIYYGHEGGEREKKDVVEYLNALDYKEYDVICMAYANRHNKAPISYFVRKK